LSRDDVERIHIATLGVLEKTGVIVGDPECVNLLKESGAIVDERGLVRFPERIVKEALASVPSSIRLYARDSRYDIRLEGQRVHFYGGAGNVLRVIDLDTGALRAPHNEDIVRFARIADGLENIHCYGAMTTTVDVPPRYADFHRWAMTFKNSTKTMIDGGSGEVGARVYIDMAASIVGSKEELRKKPLIAGYGCPVSPLRHPTEELAWLKTFAKEKLPYCTVSEPMMGVTSPATLSGAMVLMNAENLSSIVISQLFNRGAPVIYGANPYPVDMKTGLVCTASPEGAIAGAITVELAHFYRLPCQAVCSTNSKLVDAQCGVEKSLMIPCAMAGCNIIGVEGTIDSSLTASYEELVLTDEFIGVVYRLMRGIEISDELIAGETIHKVGHGGHYLSESHTRKYAMTEIWYPKLMDRRHRREWEKMGAKALDVKARERVREILKNHQPEPLEKDVERLIDKIVKEAEKTLAKTPSHSEISTARPRELNLD